MDGYALTETHLHTAEVSLCARVPANEIAQMYKNMGYEKIIVTDHWNKWTLDRFKGNAGLKNKNWLEGYNRVKKCGEELGMDIFLGMELCISGSPEDYLIYGLTEGFLQEYPDLYNKPLNKIYNIVDKSNMLIFQAHPFRPYLKVQNPSFLHGAEVFNGNVNHSNNNETALEFAEKNNLLKIAGSDFHEHKGIGLGGIYLPIDVKTNGQLVSCLKKRDYRLYP